MHVKHRFYVPHLFISTKERGKKDLYFLVGTHPRQRHRRKAVPRELRLLARIPATLTWKNPRRCQGAHPHAVADEEDDAASHPGRRCRAAHAGTRCRPDPRLDRPRRRFIPDLSLCEQNSPNIMMYNEKYYQFRHDYIDRKT